LDTSNAFAIVRIGRAHWLYAASQLAGWTYFLLWVMSMYPQLLLNLKRRSVVGLNFDYLAFSLLGYAAYALFNCSLYFVPLFRDSYAAAYPHSHIPVELNDVFFSLHGVAASSLLLLQCAVFERAGQALSTIGVVVVSSVVLLSGCQLIALVLNYIDPLSFAYFFSYVKVALTLGKYVPQAVFNYRRKSTSGWCIQNILLDINGGCLSIVQMVLLAIDYADQRYFTTNLAKLAIGGISILFDILFLTQHYVLYRNEDQSDRQPLTAESSGVGAKPESSTRTVLTVQTKVGPSTSQYGTTGPAAKLLQV
jgi:cystinosin